MPPAVAMADVESLLLVMLSDTIRIRCYGHLYICHQ